MAKENFDRSKPHVNVGSSSTIISDSSGQLSLDGKHSDLVGAQFTLSAPASVSTESFVVGYPFDSEFFVAPTRQRPALSIDYQVDILPIDLQGVSQLQATLRSARISSISWRRQLTRSPPLNLGSVYQPTT